jgi:hypothetical protein
MVGVLGMSRPADTDPIEKPESPDRPRDYDKELREKMPAVLEWLLEGLAALKERRNQTDGL